MNRPLVRSVVNYLFAMAALVGVCLLAGTAYLYGHLRRGGDSLPAAGVVVVSASVQQPTWAPIPNFSEPPTPRPTANTWPPPDPGTGPYPVCWIHPGEGLAPGTTCPPKPAGWRPPP